MAVPRIGVVAAGVTIRALLLGVYIGPLEFLKLLSWLRSPVKVLLPQVCAIFGVELLAAQLCEAQRIVSVELPWLGC